MSTSKKTDVVVNDGFSFVEAANNTDPEIYTFPTLRDKFAMAALTGILANPETPRNTPYITSDEAYTIADAMLQRRKS